MLREALGTGKIVAWAGGAGANPMTFLVFSPAGKPVLISRDGLGEEEEAVYTGLAATARALLAFAESKFQGFRLFKTSSGRQLHFLDCPPLAFLAVTDAATPGSVTRARLALLRAQVAGLFTQPALCAVYERQPGYDLRRLLVGSGDRVLRALIEGFETRPCSFLGAVPVRVMGSGRRRVVTDGLRLAVGESGSAFGGLFDFEGRLVSSRASTTAGGGLCAWDMILLGNLCRVLEQAETVLSVCLPFYDGRGNFYAYAKQHGGYTVILLNGAEIADVEVFREASMAVLGLCCDCRDGEGDGEGEGALEVDGHPEVNVVFKNSRGNQYVTNGLCPPRAGGVGAVLRRYARMRVGMFATDGADVPMAEQMAESLEESRASRRSRRHTPQRRMRPSHGFRLECVGATTYVAFASVDAEFYVSMDASMFSGHDGQTSQVGAFEYATALRAQLVRQSRRLFYFPEPSD